MSTVPFGKYKGRPVEDMLADADYMGWLESLKMFSDSGKRIVLKEMVDREFKEAGRSSK